MDDLEKRQKVYDYLKQFGLAYSVTEHPAVFSIEEMENLGITLKGDVCKNLFLRDSAGKRHFLVTMSLTIVGVKANNYQSSFDLARAAACLKKNCKRLVGSNFQLEG